MNSTIVLGRGFLGSEFERQGFTVYGRDMLTFPCHELCEILAPFDTIINCIGSADTRHCEDASKWQETYFVNAYVPKILSDHCHRYHKKFVQISTGCVYDKNNTQQSESAFTASHCRYVVSKLAGEYYCRANDLVIRPRLFFSDLDNKNNLLTKLPSFTRHLTEINSYTSTSTIVEAVGALLLAQQSGVFNVAQSGCGTIQEVCKRLGIKERPPISGHELQVDQGLALVNNIMDTSKLQRFYQPRELFSELERCWGQLKSS